MVLDEVTVSRGNGAGCVGILSVHDIRTLEFARRFRIVGFGPFNQLRLAGNKPATTAIAKEIIFFIMRIISRIGIYYCQPEKSYWEPQPSFCLNLYSSPAPAESEIWLLGIEMKPLVAL